MNVIIAPRSTTQSPQIHQQITIKKHPNFQNPPQKRPQNSKKGQPTPAEFFIQNSNPKNALPLFPVGFS
jgi:hypothetical protein